MENPEKRTVVWKAQLGTPGNVENPNILAERHWRATTQQTSEQTTPQPVFSFAATRWVGGNDSSCSLRAQQTEIHQNLHFFSISTACSVPQGAGTHFSGSGPTLHWCRKTRRGAETAACHVSIAPAPPRFWIPEATCQVFSLLKQEQKNPRHPVAFYTQFTRKPTSSWTPGFFSGGMFSCKWHFLNVLYGGCTD